MKTVATYLVGTTLFLIIGCASIGNNTNQSVQNARVSTAVGLPAQDLDVGACGIFLWDEATPQQFVFFHALDASDAKLYYQKNAIIIQSMDKKIPKTEDIHFDNGYKSSEFSSINIAGTFAQNLDGGKRIEGGTITITKMDGWVEILPVSGIYACR